MKGGVLMIIHIYAKVSTNEAASALMLVKDFNQFRNLQTSMQFLSNYGHLWYCPEWCQ